MPLCVLCAAFVFFVLLFWNTKDTKNHEGHDEITQSHNGILKTFCQLPNPFFQFKQFTVHHHRSAMKVTTDGCLFGAWAASVIQNSKVKIQTVLDIGCGTSLLSIMVAQKNNVSVDAIEIDKNAAQQAKENVAASPWKESITIIHEDVLQWKTNKKYECIISNPPFYESELKSGKQTKNIAHHDEGLKLAELLRFIKNHLTADAIFFLLLPAKRETELESLLKQFHFHLHKKIEVIQSIHHSLFRLMIKAGNKKTEEIMSEEISIKNKKDEYTPEFANLLKDYYLYL